MGCALILGDFNASTLYAKILLAGVIISDYMCRSEFFWWHTNLDHNSLGSSGIIIHLDPRKDTYTCDILWRKWCALLLGDFNASTLYCMVLVAGVSLHASFDFFWWCRQWMYWHINRVNTTEGKLILIHPHIKDIRSKALMYSVLWLVSMVIVITVN